MTPPPVRLVVFDWDGTLVDSEETIVGAMAMAFAAHGLAPPAGELVKQLVGLPLAETVRRFLPPEAPLPAVVDSYRAAYAELLARPGYVEPLYPQALEVLDALAARGLLLAVATGKSRRGLHASIARHALAARFVSLKAAEDGRGKPAPDLLLAAAADAGVTPAETVMVGDTTFDVEMGLAAGARVLGAAWGFHGAEALRQAGAHEVLCSLAEVPGALLRL